MRFSLSGLTEESSRVLTDMDPRLQRIAIHAKERGDEECEVAVMARVSDVAAWEAMADVKTGIALPMEGGEAIVTGRIAAGRIEAVRSHPTVRSLKAPHALRARLHATVPDLGANVMPAASKATGGQGVIIGLVDFGFDFAHENFCKADGTTRALGIWDQNAATVPGGPVAYGRFYTPDAINAALAQADPYTALGYQVAANDADGHGTHGTHVMDIAAGNGLGSGQPGLAPQADLIFVELSAGAGAGISDSVHLLEAVQFIFAQSFDPAGARPCVVNLSLGENAGPHDGTSLVEMALDRLVDQQANRCIVVAAGNSFSEGIHAAGQVAQDGVFDLLFTVPDDDPMDHKLEIWYAGADRLNVEILANGRTLLIVNAGETKNMTQSGATAVVAASRLNDPNNHDNQIEIFFDKELEAAAWTVRMHGANVQSGQFHAWLERDDNGAQFANAQQDSSHSLGSISTGRSTIVVGAYDAHTAGSAIFFDSSAGPTRDGRQKPEVSAPGVNVIAACARTKTGVVSRLGTSMAAPAVAGAAALLLAEAEAQGKPLTGSMIRDLLVATARVNPGPAGAWDARYGNGRVSVAAADAQLLATPAATVAAIG